MNTSLFTLPKRHVLRLTAVLLLGMLSGIISMPAVQAAVSRAEYWVDDDPGFGEGYPLGIVNNAVSLQLNTASYSIGWHVIGMRSYGNNRWGNTYTRYFYVPEADAMAAGQLTKAEYWIDSDPGFGNGIAIPFTGEQQSFALSVPETDELSVGVHLIGMRVRMANLWSTTYTRWFSVLPADAFTGLNKAEYWIDTDPGFGQATDIPVSETQTEVSFGVNETDALGVGVHLLGFRVRSGNHWSATYTRWFSVLPADAFTGLNKAEYWIDTDPGFGQATDIPVSETQTEVSFTIPETDALPLGIHQLGFRVRSGDHWSATYSRWFMTIDPAINNQDLTAVEYWLDDDPGYGEATPIPFTANQTEFSLPIGNTNELSLGYHKIGIRVRRGNVWSETYMRYFLITDIPATLTTEAVYAYWDYDTTQLISVPFTLGEDGDALVQYALPTESLSHGHHTLALYATASGVNSVVTYYDVCKTAVPQFSVLNEHICAGEDIIIMDESQDVQSNTTYAWDLNGDGTTDMTDAGDVFYTYTTPGTYAATLTLSTPDGCSTTYTKNIVVQAVSAPTVQLTADNQAVCAGESITMTATTTNAGETPIYTWYVNGAVVSGEIGETLVLNTPADGDRVQVLVTSSNPCTTEPDALSEEMTITVHELTEVSLNFPDLIYTDTTAFTLASCASVSGGRFYIDGNQMSLYNPVRYAVGEHTIRYTYTNANGCTTEVERTFTVAVRPEYTIQFVNEDNTILQTKSVKLYTLPTYTGATPTKDGNAEFSYQFIGWTPDIVVATADATYTAVYDAIVNTYTVLWQNEDGSILETDEDVAYGTMPTYDGEVPTKANDESYSYLFSGWTPEVDLVVGDVTYTATYISSVIPTGTEPASNEPTDVQKIMIDGVIYVLRAGKLFTVDGIEVR